jgi:phosphoribosyl 1,2-cyclic phosphate phosphodiesterase
MGPDGWADLDRDNPRNLRTRPSIIVEGEGGTVLVDTSPDLRMQLLAAQIWDIDAIVFTHAHADHVNGIDDIRALNIQLGGPIDAYASAETIEILKSRFPYVFEPYPPGGPQFWRPCITPHGVSGDFRAGGMEIRSFVQDHGRFPSLGLRFGPFAYCTDVKMLPEEAFDILDGVEVWMVDALNVHPHPTHSHVTQSLEWVERIGPRRTILTHMSHRVDYARLAAMLPEGVEPGYDGMVIEIPG